jgi:putative endonuclease
VGSLSNDRGRVAEEAAQRALTSAGYLIIETNFRVTGAEIDIVCRDGDGVVFAEVRGRGPGPVAPSATLDGRKLKHLMRGARAWLSRHSHARADWRFVVVEVGLDEDGRPISTEIIEDPFVHMPEFHRGDP